MSVVTFQPYYVSEFVIIEDWCHSRRISLTILISNLINTVKQVLDTVIVIIAIRGLLRTAALHPLVILVAEPRSLYRTVVALINQSVLFLDLF